ncbi:MAG: hypothetical protein HS111_18065 [Kofleriaceae bacterium]|nr:hypothetical protein [Kofleriaceae bacterium]
MFGFELRLGLGGMAQLGGANVAGVVVGGRGGYVFHLWDDDRRRVALGFTMRNGAYLADDPGNDLGANAAMFALGLSYEIARLIEPTRAARGRGRLASMRAACVPLPLVVP